MMTLDQRIAGLSRQEKEDRKLWINIVEIIFDVAYNVHEMDDAELRAKSGVSQPTLTRLWRGEFLYIHTNTLSKLFRATGLSFEAFQEAGVKIPGRRAA